MSSKARNFVDKPGEGKPSTPVRDSLPSAAVEPRLVEPYERLLGFVPPRIEGRLKVTGALDREIVEMQESVRNHAMDTPHLDPKAVQLIVFGMLLMDRNDAAETHAIASRRSGASWRELQAVVNLCFLFRGLPAANRGAEILERVNQREQQSTSSHDAG